MTLPTPKNTIKILCIPFLAFFLNCQKSDYLHLVEQEMAKGIVHDSLLLGLHFGQSKRDFYVTCWELNKKHLVKEAGGNKFVEYKLPRKKNEDLGNAITLLFYGKFDEHDIMRAMDLQFYYDGWSLWNKNLQSDKLMEAVKDSLEVWYPGNAFVQVTQKGQKERIWAKVDGNRSITIKPLDHEQIVKVKIEDLRYILRKEGL